MHQESEIRKPLIIGDKSYKDITDDIIRPIEGKANKYWWMVFTLSVVTFCWGLCCLFYTIGTGIGVWGSNNGVGLGHHQFRMVDWYRSRWYPYLCSIVVVPSKMAYGNQPFS